MQRMSDCKQIALLAILLTKSMWKELISENSKVLLMVQKSG